MNNYKDLTRLAPRYVAGAVISIIAAQKLAVALSESMNHGSLLALCLTNITALDIAHVGVLMLISLYLFMGVRTRVVALFAMVAVSAQVVMCVSHLNTMTAMLDPARLLIDFLTLMILLVSLALSVLWGGGAYALYSKGWSGLLPQ